MVYTHLPYGFCIKSCRYMLFPLLCVLVNLNHVLGNIIHECFGANVHLVLSLILYHYFHYLCFLLWWHLILEILG
jgi:hypothetical protein